MCTGKWWRSSSPELTRRGSDRLPPAIKRAENIAARCFLPGFADSLETLRPSVQTYRADRHKSSLLKTNQFAPQGIQCRLGANPICGAAAFPRGFPESFTVILHEN